MGLSHNKVAVRERAAGSPPLKELFQGLTCKNPMNNILSTSISSLIDEEPVLFMTDTLWTVNAQRKWCKNNNVNLSIQVIQIVKINKNLCEDFGLRFFCIY